jgi:cysteinyl-tRNA synthetase
MFDVKSKLNYGKLNRRRLTDMQNGVDHPELGDLKRHPGDFVLWKPSTDNQPGWASDWGRGRPGWHIECSAMSQKTLSGRIDIHGGGEDLKFPHHENEIAQSECSHPEHQHVKYWLHNSMVTVDGKKMSKSVGNVVTVNQLLESGVKGVGIRYMLLGTHYRRPLDFTQDRISAAELELSKWYDAIYDVDATMPSSGFMLQLFNDMNVAGSIGILRYDYRKGNYGSLKAGMELLGLLGST